MLYTIIPLVIWLLPIVIPFNESFFQSLNLNYYLPKEVFIMYYVLSIIFLSISITKILQKKLFNNDYLFLFCTLWIFNILTFIYFSFFENIFWTLIFIFLELLNLFIIIFKLKKTSKGLTKYLFLFLTLYIYLLFLLGF